MVGSGGDQIDVVQSRCRNLVIQQGRKHSCIALHKNPDFVITSIYTSVNASDAQDWQQSDDIGWALKQLHAITVAVKSVHCMTVNGFDRMH